MVGGGLLVAGIAGVTAHFIGPVSNTATIVAAFTPLLILAALAASVVFAVGRRWWAAGLAVVVTAVGLWSQLPLYRADPAAAAAVGRQDIRLMQANIMLGQADPNAVVAAVRDRSVDVLTVIELTESARSGVEAAGLRELLPYSVTFPRFGGGGAGIYSRYPLESGELLAGFALNNIRAELKMPGAEHIAVYALHPIPPFPEPAWKWAAELERLHTVLGGETQTMVIGADFNSTFDHKRFRDLLAGSGAAGSPELRDAAEYVGAGIVATYPADRRIPRFWRSTASSPREPVLSRSAASIFRVLTTSG
ncbi:endonuclease/exonuclease/phosphatase family protein [Mycobacterium sp. MS1601]|uniref:endonuclease/exonuclease/phosphatase family protein n=1 Tax=Mycobacterium sp. MS1601 TaxID=1936029 RepID=UPI001F3C90F5|nr:endonuclease/exonuclease/phosphatase family protein [Mycobacterium sp. MS1601]